MTALLIDPLGRAPVPPEHRIDSVFDLPRLLGTPAPRSGGRGDRVRRP